VAPDLQIADPDGGSLSRATVEIVSGNSGVDALTITQSLAGTGITPVEDGSAGRVVLEGNAPIATYETILQSIVLEAGGILGERAISIQVEDDQGAASAPVVTRIDFNTTSLVLGGNGDDAALQGTAGSDPISGRGGDDQLFGLAGDDLLDGGEGNDFLDGGPGRDLLFGGPGNDTLTGGADADRFFLLSLPDRGDQLLDFNATEGDVLDLSALFDGQANAGNINDFLQFNPSGVNDIQVSADIDGASTGFDFLQVVTLVDPTGVTTVQEAVNNGSVAV
jgi:Ca2+-binding RTX toxin-like protein